MSYVEPANGYTSKFVAVSSRLLPARTDLSCIFFGTQDKLSEGQLVEAGHPRTLDRCPRCFSAVSFSNHSLR